MEGEGAYEDATETELTINFYSSHFSLSRKSRKSKMRYDSSICVTIFKKKRYYKYDALLWLSRRWVLGRLAYPYSIFLDVRQHINYGEKDKAELFGGGEGPAVV